MSERTKMRIHGDGQPKAQLKAEAEAPRIVDPRGGWQPGQPESQQAAIDERHIRSLAHGLLMEMNPSATGIAEPAERYFAPSQVRPASGTESFKEQTAREAPGWITQEQAVMSEITQGMAWIGATAISLGLQQSTADRPAQSRQPDRVLATI